MLPDIEVAPTWSYDWG